MKNSHINYIEFKATDLEAIKKFYQDCFGWTFTDYGPTYVAFSESGLEGGFEKTDTEVINGALVVLYHKNLEEIKDRVMAVGGNIVKDIFSFLEAAGSISLIQVAMNWQFGPNDGLNYSYINN